MSYMEFDIVLLVCRVMDSRNLQRENPADRQPAKSTGKQKRCEKCGCQCMSNLTPPKPRPHCPTYLKYHYGECWKATEGCYRCGDLGHHIRDYPKPSRKSGKLARAQAETAETSATQQAPSQVPAQVIPVPQPEAEVAPEVNSGIEISGRNFYKEGRIVTSLS